MEARANVPITSVDVEVVAKARRRAFTAEYKRRAANLPEKDTATVLTEQWTLRRDGG